ncbi:potassium uptake protein, TrkH family [Peptoanaerobacter stomatis]|uniref:Potassium uptake protein, TrkH family n=1 Tax=Peptoanaerobacter stomatis TaxID=796937 RepID=J4WEW6_9FIRM|nr:TrkH family potassium uptake protein [Peptoanaerobacter stomatis]EJU23876.1 potassium uptake protein, TrkH family [Peptoanaerobacter stomatis]NWO24166.1 Trk family potassium uptake protein [Peptostreptococcaceae bacterium oral taxon 081]
MMSVIYRKLSQSQILAGGFLLIAVIGGLILNLPISSANNESVGLLNAMFTSISAVCVTGLIAVDTGTYWSLFGKTVIIILIQIGGLGFMTIATMGIKFMGKKISFSERLVIQESLNSGKISGVIRLSKNIVIISFIIELIGMFFLSFVFIPEMGIIKGIAYSIFHSISAFCNAGFDIMGNFSSLTKYYNNMIVNFTIMFLIIFGGLGFSTILDIKDKKNFYKLALHTKIVIITTSLLILIPSIIFFLIEMNNPQTIGEMKLWEKVLVSLFQIVSPRTAGFNTIDINAMRDSSKFLTIILMFIGGSPASTAGGLKTTTFAIILISVISLIKERENIEAFGRRISYNVLNKALVILVIGFFLVFTGTMIISLTNPQFDFLTILYEVTSAYGTVGLTLGITTKLNAVAKMVLMIIMFSGRVGSLTVLYTFITDLGQKKYIYPKEDIAVG